MGKMAYSSKIEDKIYKIRGKRAMFDKDLAELYEVETKVLIQAIKRHANRFPKDFMFQVTKEEFVNLRSQIVTSSWGGRRYLPYAFTEQGVAMLSSVLNSERAIEVNIAIMRVFVNVRKATYVYENLKRKIDKLEEKYDDQFRIVFEAIRQLVMQPEQPKRKIGFNTD